MRTFQEYLKKIKPQVDERIGEIARQKLKDPDIILMLMKGKRLRAGLLLLVHDSVSQSSYSSKALDLACAVELAHSASLILDDMLDEDTERRGLPTVHLKKGHKKAMLETIGVLSLPYDIVSQYGEVYVKTLAEVQRSMVGGVLKELFHDPELPATKLYDVIITHKTGRLFSLATGWGCIAALPPEYHSGNFAFELVQIEGEKPGIVMDQKGRRVWIPPCKEYNACVFGAYGVQCGKAMQIADDIADIQKVIEGKKTEGFGSEMLLLRCVNIDNLIKDLFKDIKNRSVDIKNAKRIWSQKSVQATLFDILDKEINQAKNIVSAIGVQYLECEEILMDAPGSIADMMLRE